MVLMFLYLSILDLIGIGLIGPFIFLVTMPERIQSSEYYELALNMGLPSDHNELVVILSLILALIFLIKAISGVLINRQILFFCIGFGASMKAFLMSSYQNMPYEKYISKNSAEYIYKIQEVAVLFSHTVLISILRGLSAGIVFIMIVTLLAWVDGRVLLLLVSVIVGVMFLYERIFKKKIQNYGKKANQLSSTVIKAVNEGMGGFKEINILGKENYFYEIVKNNSAAYASAKIKSGVVTSIPRYMNELIIILFIVSLVVFYSLSGKDISMLLPMLSLFGVAAMRLVPSGNEIMNSISTIHLGRDAVSLLYTDIKNLRDIKLYNKNLSINKGDPEDSIKEFNRLELRNIEYTYPIVDFTALTNISLSINSGESIGIIGASGSGKTTLIDLILGLLVPKNGEILINNVHLNNSASEWKKHIAYLPQEVFLVDNTVRKNIALGIEDDKIDNEKVIKSIEQARLTAIIDQLPEGLDTMLGERGMRLSGGQRQRVAIARAFYHDRDILIMDESTSALDTKTEKEIVEAMKQLKGKKTIIAIAHRLTTLRHCNRIYKLEDGKIVNVGSYDEFIKEAD